MEECLEITNLLFGKRGVMLDMVNHKVDSKTVEELYKLFQHPSAQYRGKPLWSWNGKLDKDELLRQIHVLKEMGFGGFFMHSRTGLATEYLGEEWFAFINACTDEAEKLGLEAWLYDEDRWPSGSAGGKVTENPRHRMKSIQMHRMKAQNFMWSEQMIAAFSVKLQGVDLHDYSPISRMNIPDLDQGDDVLAFTIEEMARSNFYNGNTYLDTLNGESVQQFIASTHEQYKRHSGDRLGHSILGVFTDEPHRGRLMSSFGSSPGEENDALEYSVPWTYALFDHFEKAYGYDLKNRLPELFFNYRGAKVSPLKWQYVELVQQMFITHFVKPINEWCKANNLALTGHMLQEDSLAAQTAMCGSAMRFYEHMGYPGIDVLTEHNRNFWIAKQVTSVARQLGQPWRLSELYGCTGWQMPFESHKMVGDWQALLGINFRCHHLSWYTMQGESKRDYPASISHQSAWWKEYKYVEDYFSRLGVAMSGGTSVCDTLVLHPIESVWCQVYSGWSAGLHARDEAIVKLEQQFVSLFHWLTEAHIDFDYGDEEMMSRLCKVETDETGRACLKVGEAVYRQIIVSGMTTIRSTTLHILDTFMRAGGHVLFAGEPPEYVDAVKSDKAIIMSGQADAVAFKQQDLIKACVLHVDRMVNVQNSQGDHVEQIYVQVREGEDYKLVMLLNVDRENHYDQLTITIQSDGFVQEWDSTTGERYDTYNSDDGIIRCTMNFPAGGEKLLIITSQRNDSLDKRVSCVERNAWTVDSVFDYTLDESNICVLDSASFQIDDGPWQPETEILQIDRRVREAFGIEYRAGNMVQPWFAGDQEFEAKGRVSLRFEFDVHELSAKTLELAMEQPERFQMKLNGLPINSNGQRGWWVDICFKKIEIQGEHLQIGKNIIEISTDFHQGIDLEALYLLGNFGVALEGNRKAIISLPAYLTIGDLSQQGLPFYSGKVTYRVPVDYKPANGEESVFLELEQIGGACAKVNPEGSTPTMIAWRPYEADITNQLKENRWIDLQIILTRRNTFGPLHQIPLYAPDYGPENFVTTGSNFTETYNLVPAGLLSSPRISIRS